MDRPGEIPMTSPPFALAPFTASYGSPGQPPVIMMASRSAIASPSRYAFARTSSLSSPPLDPITPIVSFIAFEAPLGSMLAAAMSTSRPLSGGFGHDLNKHSLNLLGNTFQLRVREEIDHFRGLDGGELGLATLFVDRDSTRERGRDLQVCLQDPLRLLGVAHLQDPALPGKWHSLFGHLRLQVQHHKHSKLVARD